MNTFSCVAALFFLTAIVVAVGAAFYVTRELKKSHPSPKSNSTPPQPSAPVSNVPPAQQTTTAPLTGKQQTAATPLPAASEPTSNAKLYRRAQMTRAEGHFYDFLNRIVGEEYIIDTRTPLSELFKRYGRLEKELYTMYANGHVDFVLLEPTLKTPIIAIELDGRTHTDPIQINRDKRKEELFRLANMTLLRFRTGVLWGEKERAEILAALPKPLKS